MKLTEIFPEGAKIVLDGKEYELKYNTRAKLELEKVYPDEAPVRQAVQNLVVSGMKATDMVNIVHACLVGSKNPIDKEALIDALEPQCYNVYANAILYAFMTAQLTPEQLEKLEVLETQSKKKEPESEITAANTPGLESSAE